MPCKVKYICLLPYGKDMKLNTKEKLHQFLLRKSNEMNYLEKHN